MNNELTTKELRYKRIIILLSIVIPVTVAILFKIKINGVDLSFLPPVYATINGLTAILLISALVAIKQGRINIHQKLMKTCLGLSACFLVLYVLYHITSDSTSYGGEGPLRIVYYFILISHILLSIAVIPLVLFTYLQTLISRFDKHKRLARITFPIWLYVAITGVIVYLMISPYYTHG